MDRTALIIGGTGQIGRATAEALTGAGYRVTSAQRGERTPLEPVTGETVVLDREDLQALRAAARGHDLVVDTVAFTPAHARQLLLLAGDVGSLVVISTGSVYLGTNGASFDTAQESGYPEFPVPIDEMHPTITSERQTYGALKAAMERELLASRDLPVSILRAGATHGPHSPKLREWYFIKRVLDGRPHVVLARNGANRFSTSSTLNIAALVLACAVEPGTRVLNAVDDESLSAAGIAQTVLSVMGSTASLLGVPGPPVNGAGATPWDAPADFVLSMERARAEVGYQPAVSYRESVERDIQWVQAAVDAADARGGTWRDVFPSVGTRYGPQSWFDYASEDGLLASAQPIRPE